MDTTKNFPRRNRVDLYAPAEAAISASVLEVEKMDGDTRLTEAVILLGKAQSKVADYVDGIESSSDNSSKLPSMFQIGDLVTLNFGSAGKVTGADIIKVHFTESKVFYDVMIVLDGPLPTVNSDEIGKSLFTRLYNIDSCFVEPAE